MVYESDGEERILTGHTGHVFIAMTVLLVCLQLTQRLLPPLMPAIIEDLGITAFLAGISLTVLRISKASMEYPGGRFADQYSRTAVILGCGLLAIVGLTIIAFTFTFWGFMLGVVVFGSGLGLFSPASRALLSDIFEEKRGAAFGLHLMGGDIAGILSAGIAIVIVAIAGWRGTFFPLVIVLAVVLVAFHLVSREPITRSSTDFGLKNAVSRLFKDGVTRWILVVYTLFVMASSGVISFLPTFLIDVHGFSFAIASSSYALVYAIGMVSKPTAGVVSDWSSRTLVSAGCFVLAAGGLILMVVADIRGIALLGVVVYALGQRGAPAVMQTMLMDRFPDESMGSDLGVIRTLYISIGSLGPAITGFLATAFDFRVAYAALILFFGAGGMILLRFTVFGLPERPVT